MQLNRNRLPLFDFSIMHMYYVTYSESADLVIQSIGKPEPC